MKKIIKKIKDLEKELTGSNKMKLFKEWRPIDHINDWHFFQSEKGGRVETVNFISLFLFFPLFSLYLFF